MSKRILLICLISFVVSSCNLVKYSIEDNIEHYKKLIRYSEIKPIQHSQYTNSVEGVNFIVANYPDQIINIKGSDDFDKRYYKIINYLKDNGYTILLKEKKHLKATVIAEVNKPIKDLRYIGILMIHYNNLLQTVYNIYYGGSKFKARQFYNDYKRTL